MPKSYKDTEEYKTFTDTDSQLAEADEGYGEKLATYKQNYNKATTDEERGFWKGQADFLSYGKGYQRNGSGTDLTKLREGLGSVDALLKSTGKTSSYADALDGILRSYIDGTYRYDPKSDARYKLAEEYAKDAMLNQMAESAALSGGYGNSYAAHAGQRVYDDYMKNAEASLEADAYGRYKDGQNRALQIYGLLSDRENAEYNRAWNEDNRAASEKNAEYTRALGVAQTLAQYGDFSGYKDLGYSDAQIENMQKAYARGETGTAKEAARAEIDAILAARGKVSDIPEELKSAAGYTDAYLTTLERYYASKDAGSQKGGAGALSRFAEKLLQSGVTDKNAAYLSARDAGYSVTDAKTVAEAVEKKAQDAEESRGSAQKLIAALSVFRGTSANAGAFAATLLRKGQIGKMTEDDLNYALDALESRGITLDEPVQNELYKTLVGQ